MRALRRHFLVAGVLVSLTANGQSLPIEITRSVQITKDLPPPAGSSSDRWANGYLPMFTRTPSGVPPEVWMYDRNGSLVIPKRQVWFPNIFHVAVQSVAPTPEGNLIIVSEVWQSGGNRTISTIAEMIPDGTLKWVSRTESLADQIIVGKDVILALGGPALTRFDKDASFQLISRYSRAGNLLTSALPFQAASNKRYEDIRRNSRIVSAGDGSMAFYNAGSGEWTEFDPTGQATSTIKVSIPLTGSDRLPYSVFNIVMTTGKEVYAWFYSAMGNIEDRGIYRLDRSDRAWVKATTLLPQFHAGIYGIDGDYLITRTGETTYAWFYPPSF